MSNRPSRPTTYPAHPVTAASSPTYLRSTSHTMSTDRPTATYPIDPASGRPRRPDPAGYVHPADPRLAQADATPTSVFPTNRSARTPARYHTPQTDRQSVEAGQAPDQHEQPPSEPDRESIQDMGRPGPLSRPSMRWHPSLMQLAIGAALVAALLGACNVAAISAYRTARAYCHALVSQDWDRAQRECRGTGAGTPQPGQAGTSYPSATPSPSAAPAPPEDRALTRVTTPPTSSSAASTSAPSTSSWVTSDTHAPYDRTDPQASPLDLPRCTTASNTPTPCLAHVSSDGARAVVLEEDGSMSGLTRR